MNATERGVELACMPMRNVPIPALIFAKFLMDVGGMCGETFITAYAIYAQVVEGLEPDPRGDYAATERWREAYAQAQREYEHLDKQTREVLPLDGERRGVLVRKAGLPPTRMP